MREKTRGNTNLVASCHIERENGSLPVDVRRSKTLWNLGTTDANRKYFCSMTATEHVKTFLSCGHGLQNASSHVETRGSNSGFFEEYLS